MIAVIARKEFQDPFRDRRIRLSAWIVGLLLITGFVISGPKETAGLLAAEGRCAGL